jgi:hypothetical protein
MTTERTKHGIEAYPLTWPADQPRRVNLEQSKFDTSFVKAREHVFWEAQRMSGKDIVLSCNIPLMRDGMPRANYTPADPAVALYFNRKGRNVVFACDKYNTVADNMWAIVKTIEALRGIERWGTQQMMDRAFAGFARLPEKPVESWRDALNLAAEDLVTLDLVEARFRYLAKVYHPDTGSNSDPAKFQQVLEARNRARVELSR